MHSSQSPKFWRIRAVSADEKIRRNRRFSLKKLSQPPTYSRHPFQELNMKKDEYRSFYQKGGHSFTLHFEPPLSTQAEQAAVAESRTYKEVFRRAIEEYLRNHHPGLLGREAQDA
jgi:hypothetical protein